MNVISFFNLKKLPLCSVNFRVESKSDKVVATPLTRISVYLVQLLKQEHCDDPILVFPLSLLIVHVRNLPLSLPSFVMLLDSTLCCARSYSRHESSGASSASASGGKQTSCPLCSRKTWAQQEQDLWRLERWLEHAENQFRAHERIPTNMEQLEDTVQDFRVCSRVCLKLGVQFSNPLGCVFKELSLDLDSHKNIIMSLNIVVNHVAEHAVTADLRAADRLRNRLAAANNRWEAVCKSAGRIQGRLQAALMQVLVAI